MERATGNDGIKQECVKATVYKTKGSRNIGRPRKNGTIPGNTA